MKGKINTSCLLKRGMSKRLEIIGKDELENNNRIIRKPNIIEPKNFSNWDITSLAGGISILRMRSKVSLITLKRE